MIRIGNKVVAGSADVDLSTVLKSLNKTGLSVWVGTQTEHDALPDTVKNNDKTTFITYDTDEDVYLIIDTIVSYGKTWSSVKISSELAKKINASDVYTKEQVDDIINAKLASALKYRGAVNTTALLPASAENGDTYFVKADGFMYAYNSTLSAWDALGTVADMTNYFTKTEITALLQDKADKFQYDVLPTASSETVGILVQYTGADTQDYKNGYFYKGIDNGNDTYDWELAKIGEYEDIIDDEITSVNTTWSSDKISGELADALEDKVDYKLVVEDGNRYVEDIVTQDINTWLPNDNSSIFVNLKKKNISDYANFQLLCNKKDSQNWSCIVSGATTALWKIRYLDGVRYIDELATTNDLANKADKTDLVDWYHTTNAAYAYKNAYDYYFGEGAWLSSSETYFKVYGKDDDGTCFTIIKVIPNVSLAFYRNKANGTYFTSYNQHGTIATAGNNMHLYIKPISKAEFDMEQELATDERISFVSLTSADIGTTIDIPNGCKKIAFAPRTDNSTVALQPTTLFMSWITATQTYKCAYTDGTSNVQVVVKVDASAKKFTFVSQSGNININNVLVNFLA